MLHWAALREVTGLTYCKWCFFGPIFTAGIVPILPPSYLGVVSLRWMEAVRIVGFIERDLVVGGSIILAVR